MFGEDWAKYLHDAGASSYRTAARFFNDAHRLGEGLTVSMIDAGRNLRIEAAALLKAPRQRAVCKACKLQEERLEAAASVAAAAAAEAAELEKAAAAATAAAAAAAAEFEEAAAAAAAACGEARKRGTSWWC